MLSFMRFFYYLLILNEKIRWKNEKSREAATN